ncbi:hypothetical protein EDC04DRAFT_2668726 [Pisolithus marmoratus]|nr:hypothetical protein EDC04DRAFT_2668726 [Pisolithus marmoratus]
MEAGLDFVSFLFFCVCRGIAWLAWAGMFSPVSLPLSGTSALAFSSSLSRIMPSFATPTMLASPPLMRTFISDT